MKICTRCIWLAIVILCMATGSKAQSEKKAEKALREEQKKEESIKEDDIDQDYNKCVVKDTTCANVSDCAFMSYAKWEKRMTDEYERLMRELSEEHKTVLRESQTAWLGYKDATFKDYDVIFDKAGDAWCRIRHEGRIDVVRKRALQLRSYFEELKRK